MKPVLSVPADRRDTLNIVFLAEFGACDTKASEHRALITRQNPNDPRSRCDPH